MKRKRRPVGFWSRKTVRQAIRERKMQSLSLHASQVNEEDSSLYRYGRQLHCSWEQALRCARVPIPPARPVIWSKAKIIRIFQMLYCAGVPLRNLWLRRHGFADVESSARKHFRLWRNAIRAAGLDFDHVRMYRNGWWNKSRVLTAIERLVRAGLRPSTRAAAKACHGVVEGAKTCFGSWMRPLEILGINHREACAQQRRHYSNGGRLWDKRCVLAEIKRLAQAGVRLSIRAIQKTRGDLVAAAYTYCGGWGEAVEAAGIDYKLHCLLWSPKTFLRHLDDRRYQRLMHRIRRLANERRAH